MDLRQLRYFVAIIEHRGISNAARASHVAASALSHHLANMEADLGVQLFLRQRRGLVPTAAGERLYVHAKSILKSLQAAEHDIRDQGREIVGEVSVAMAQSVIKTIGLELYTQVRDGFPRLRLEVTESLSGSTLQLLLADQCDIALVYNPPNDPSLKLFPLLREEMVLVGRPSVIGETDEPIQFSEVLGLPLLLLKQGVYPQALIDDSRLIKQLEAVARSNIGSLAVLGPLLASGAACAISTTLALQDYIEDGTLRYRRVEQPELWRNLYICEKVDKPTTYAAEKVRQMIVDAAQEAVRERRWNAHLLTAD